MSYKINKEEQTLIIEEPLTIGEGLILTPKSRIKDRLQTDISRINITSKDLIDTVIKKKLKRQLEKVVAATISVLEDDDEDPDNITRALDEAAKFQAMLKYKYQQFLTSEFEAEQHRKLKDVIKELSRKRVYQEEEVKETNKSR